jgi:hypothetical protein
MIIRTFKAEGGNRQGAGGVERGARGKAEKLKI